jgi:hypothetical protein
MKSLETKMLKALDYAVDDEAIIDGSIGPWFDIGGDLQFLETLIGLCTKEERAEFIQDWVIANMDDEFVDDMCSQLTTRSGANYMVTTKRKTAESILKHFDSDVREMLHEHSKAKQELSDDSNN